MPWSALRNILQSKLALSTILVPVIGYAILFNEKFISSVDLAPEVGMRAFVSGVIHPPSESTLAKMYFYYFGFSLFSVSALIYKVCAPKEIKSAPDSLIFEGNRYAALTLMDVRVMLKRILNLHDRRIGRDWIGILYPKAIRQNIKFFVSDLSREAGRQYGQDSGDKVLVDLRAGTLTISQTDQMLNLWTSQKGRETLRSLYEAEDVSRFLARVICAVVLALGLVGIAIPAVETFCSILVTALPHLVSWLFENFPNFSTWIANFRI